MGFNSDLLWEINHSSQAVYENAGSDVQCALALLSGAGLCAESTGASLTLVCHANNYATEGPGRGGSKGSHHWRPQVLSPLETFPYD